MVHELSHQVGLIDLYNLNIPDTRVKVLDQHGEPSNFGFRWPSPKIMSGDYAPQLFADHSVAGISSTKGYRRGYYGEYQFDVPNENYLLILDNQGNPVNGVQVNLYQRTGPIDWIGEASIDNIPEITGTTGPDGRFLLTNRSANGGITTKTNHTLQDNPFGIIDVVAKETRFLVRLQKDNHEEFWWLDITDFNLAY